MVGYNIYTPKKKNPLALIDVDNFVFVKDGFAWLAVLSPILWAIYHKLWTVALVLIGASMIFYSLLTLLDFTAFQKAVIFLIVQCIFAIEANRIRAWALKQEGYQEEGFVTGDSKTQCQRRFFKTWLLDKNINSTD